MSDRPTNSYETRLAKAREYKEKNKGILAQKQKEYLQKKRTDPSYLEHRRQLKRDWVAKNPDAWKKDRDARDKEKMRARNAVRQLIWHKRIQRGSCVICGKGNAHAHHEDYAKRFEIHWLCDQHHKAVHEGEIDINNIPPSDITPSSYQYRARAVLREIEGKS